ncbi:MAG: adenylate/guanylate cyclase domain-containing protein, partial [bacterium]
MPDLAPGAESERRRVTILFADIAGFTALSEKMDPEDVYRLMNRCFERLGNVIKQHEGTVDKFIGDCVMALFGAPVTHENDPERAVRAALGLQEEIRAFNGEQEQDLRATHGMRIGINSGLVIAGAVGSEEKRQYTVMGDAVNVASRIESAALPGGVLVSESVYRQTWRTFEYRACEPIRVKGREQPVAVYELICERKETLEARGIRRSSAFVGRDSEMRVLAGALESAVKGTGSFVCLIGQTGVGKTRLLEEFGETAAARGMPVLRVSCLASEARTAYACWRRLLLQLCGIE